ncbi:MAG: thioredoxin family protein [Myxococcales bacterium]|nr:thioredoxin family protein [Myxococcales bacterium]
MMPRNTARTPWTIFGAAALALCCVVGCSSKSAGGEAPQAEKKPVPRDAAATPPDAAAKVAKAAEGQGGMSTPKRAAGGHGGAKEDIKWAGPVAFTTWEAGLAKAKAENKPIMLVVYADWCPRCRELAPALQTAEVAALADKVVMVKQDSDERPAWLAPITQQYGGYVPRVFLMKPDGTVREELNSGHPRYPYFYTPRNVDALVKHLKTLAGS